MYKTDIIQEKMKIQYTNEFTQKLGMSDTTTCVYQLIYDENDSVYTDIIQ